MAARWSKEKAWEWYNSRPWIRGCNYMGSDCANRLDMFQQYKSEEKLKTAERELALCQKIGFNTVRIWANFDVYYAEPESYMEIFEKYISLCAKYGQKVMIVLTHEEDLPRGEKFVPKPMGEQKYALGYHQGRFPLNEEEKAIFDKIKTVLEDRVVKVVGSNDMGSHPVCLSTEGEVSLEMEKVLKNQMGGSEIKAQKVLKLNLSHPLISKLKSLDQRQLEDYGKILYAQASLIAGLEVENPTWVTEKIIDLLCK